jgi:hypothetical protein
MSFSGKQYQPGVPAKEHIDRAVPGQIDEQLVQVTL